MFSNIIAGAAGFPVADLGDTVQHSLRFNRNQWLESDAVTLSTYTASIWLKLGRMRNPSVSGGVTQIIIGTAGTAGHGVGFSNNKLYSTHTGDESTEEFRDPSAWYHLVINSTGNLYINGVEIATGGGLHDPDDEEIVLGHIWPQNSQNSIYAFEGLLANYHFIDGQELTPTSFGRTNEDGVWVPRTYTGTYGTNGARLIFDSSAGIGNDTSGNNNDYTVGGTFDTTAIGSSNFDNDVDYNDTPTSNYSTGNPIQVNANTETVLSEANLTWTNSAASQRMSTIPISDGKWYFEYHIDGSTVSDEYPHLKLQGINGETTGALSIGPRFFFEQGVTSDWTSHDLNIGGNTTVRVTYDSSNGEVEVTSSGGNTFTRTWTAGDTGGAYADGETVKAGVGFGINSGVAGVKVNFGQRDFVNSIPAGFSELQTNNLDEPTIKNGKEYFETIIWDGDDVDDRAITTTEEFAPDLVWIKCRDANNTNHEVYDTIRGAGNRILPNLVNEQDSPTGNLKSFTTTGFTLGTSGNVNGDGNSYVAWCWRAGETFTPSQTGGLTNLSGTRNTTAGFSIIRYRGAGANATVGHGLNSTPEFIIFKDYTDTNQENWNIYHSAFRPRAAQGETINFNTSSAADYGATLYNETAPTSSVIHLGNNVDINDSGEDVIAYCWHGVEGYSKFGQYEGNGTSGDGPFVYTGHAPQFLIIKAMDVSGDWVMLDSIRTPNNPNNVAFKGNAAIQEAADNNYTVDFLSNGFKVRNNADADLNQNNRTYIYMSWATHPFGGENTPPVTAR